MIHTYAIHLSEVQKSLDTGKLPLSLSQANIAPIFKKGDRSLVSNYRPISLTSICCKILDHIIFTNIMNHFDYHSVLIDRQHGFRSKHSTESQLIITTQDLAQSLNNKLQVDMIIMDFSKAFDTVPHNRLLNKLNRYGIRNKSHNWISITFSNIVNKELLLVENTPHGHKSFQVYLKGQYSARYFSSLTLMICRIISIRQSACLQMTVYYTEK